MRWVQVRVPGTTANLGPGFDSLGVALRLYNRVKLRRAVAGVGVWGSDQEGSLSEGARVMIRAAAKLFFKRARVAAFEFDLRVGGKVPVARGLGSSVTVRLGVVAGLNALAAGGLDRLELLEIVNELEGHPDNAAPAVLGGFTVAGMVGGRVRTIRAVVAPRLRFVTLIPDFEVSTEQARLLVPKWFSKEDTVHSLNRAALIGAGFAGGKYEALEGVFDDRLHQPYRELLIPQLSKVIRAGVKAGAIGGWLSGSGSTIICLTVRRPLEVARAMKRGLARSDVLVLGADNAGFKLL